jgi:8-hydroxy-5-deazaflavin:NADPH oxidoreductase
MLGDLRGKVIIDCNNPFDAETGLVQEAYRSRSMAEAIAEAAPGVNVVKAYNTIPSAVLAKDPPRISGQITTTFLCGDDAEAKALIATLSRDAGLDPLDCGPLERARLVEAAAALMINFIFGGAGPNIALNLAH